MKIKSIFAATATAMLLSTTSLSAQSDAVIDAIVQELVGMGYTHIEIKKGRTSIKVEASGATGSLERVYGTDGTVLREEVSVGDTGGAPGTDGYPDGYVDDSSDDDAYDDDGYDDDGYDDDGYDDDGYDDDAYDDDRDERDDERDYERDQRDDERDYERDQRDDERDYERDQRDDERDDDRDERDDERDDDRDERDDD